MKEISEEEFGKYIEKSRKEEKERRLEICKQRSAIKRRNQWKNNKGGIYRKKRQTKYGVTEKDYQKILEEQKGGCSICEGNGVRALAVDHDHFTGKHRGLLCVKCNLALGHANDDVKILQNMIDYLNYWNAQHNDVYSVDKNSPTC